MDQTLALWVMTLNTNSEQGIPHPKYTHHGQVAQVLAGLAASLGGLQGQPLAGLLASVAG